MFGWKGILGMERSLWKVSDLPKVIAYTDGSAIRQVGNPKKYHGGAGVVLVYKGKMKEITY